MRFRFSWRVTIVCGALILGMLRLSLWQWHRHLEKIAYIAQMNERLAQPVVELSTLLGRHMGDGSDISYRRVWIEGEFDYSKEMVLRNRRYEDRPGVFVLTPLKLKNSEQHLLVSRGFIPLNYATRPAREVFQRSNQAAFFGLLKESVSRRYLAPKDPTPGGENPWVDAWLRVDLENIQKQLPYPILPVFAERMGDSISEVGSAQLIATKSGRDELFDLTSSVAVPKSLSLEELGKFPIATYDTVIPPGRHRGYVFEWAAMALITLAIAIILQFRRPQSL